MTSRDRLSRDESIELVEAAQELREATSGMIRGDYEWDLDMDRIRKEHTDAWSRMLKAIQPLVGGDELGELATEWEYGVDDVGMHPSGAIWAAQGEKRLINFEVTMAVPNRLHSWYGVNKIYRRRKAGSWEEFDFNRGEASG